MLISLLSWYAIVQVIALLALPLSSRFFAVLPDRGYVFAKTLGILFHGYILLIGTSYGLLRNDIGGAWLAVAILGCISFGFGWPYLVRWRDNGMRRVDWRYVVSVEALFLFAYGLWAFVRSYDPAVNHTEQPMDLMFMNSIWTSPTFPPQDAWLAGYPISYYYFGYWLLVALGRLAGAAPEFAYNLGQSCWFGLLWISCFGLVANLLTYCTTEYYDTQRQRGCHVAKANTLAQAPTRISISSIAGGLLASITVGFLGNLQVLFEWIYANGVNLHVLNAWLNVNNFPENAIQSNAWFIGYDWWWWRSSRVISDQNLFGEHMEVIDEFPMFSYILGDNHPHVLAMPFVVLTIGVALTLFIDGQRYLSSRSPMPTVQDKSSWLFFPVAKGCVVVAVIIAGSLLFLNTWDYPPYWLLLCLVYFVLLSSKSSCRSIELSNHRVIHCLRQTVTFGLLLAFGAVAAYFPYFLTAQSQASGVVPNFFNPTRLPQFILMFGSFFPAIIGILWIAWREMRPSPRLLTIVAATLCGGPILFLILGMLIAINSRAGQNILYSMVLPDGSLTYVDFMVQRWSTQFGTFLLIGTLLSITITLIWKSIATARTQDTPNRPSLTFVLLLLSVGLGLTFAPEFIFLRDNFGTRMNTVFKFYYQAWLIFGLCSAFFVVYVWRLHTRGGIFTKGLAVISCGLFACTLLFPVAGIYSKTNGFRQETQTLNAIAYIGTQNSEEMAAIQWIRSNVPYGAIILEGKGVSYQSSYNRISTTTGRPTLVGWEGHESQWRGRAYVEMAQGRSEVLDTVYGTGSPEQIDTILKAWGIMYVYVGPTERAEYGITPRDEERLDAAMDVVFSDNGIRVYRRR